MPTQIDTDELRRLIDGGAVLVEVLPKGAYDEEHLPGARNVPLVELRPDAVADLDPAVPIVAYCFDYQ
jgi:rhodanese-related sulfurtransferase